MRASRKKLAVGAAVAAGVLGISVGAFAYWTSTGTGAGSATTGSATAWGVSTSTSGGPLFPGSGIETVSYTITNNGAGVQALNSVVVTVDSDLSGDVLSTATGNPPIAGCKAAWFAVTDTAVAGAPLNLASGGTYPGSSTIVMNNLTTVNQNACQNKSFTVTATAS